MAGIGKYGWLAYFSSGIILYYYGPVPYADKTSLNYIRCVRGGKFDAGCDDLGGRLGWMCNVPEGPFMMGCNVAVDTECQSDEYPYHQVTVPAFKMDKYEVTASEYKACVTAGGCTTAAMTGTCTYDVPGLENHPINCVNWDQSRAYCGWAGKRLPTEAEWEKAARGTDGRKYPWGNDSLDCDHAVQAVTGNCGVTTTAPVGSKPPGESPYGTEDMIGNVWECVEDYYHDSYAGAPSDGGAWSTPAGTYRILRGGSYSAQARYNMRASARFRDFLSDYGPETGFRCAVSQ